MNKIKFAKRLDLIENASSIEINQIVYEKKASGEEVRTFSLGEAVFDIPMFDITEEEFIKGYRYSSSLGQIELRKKIALHYQQSYCAGHVSYENVIISAGSKVILYMTFLALLNIGDEVLVPEPAWLSYKEQVTLVGGEVVNVPYSVGISDWEQYVTSKTKCIVINTPNNPSGKVYSREELQQILSICKKHSMTLICDEAYSDFVSEGDFVSLAEIDEKMENSVIVNSLSKNMGMSGWRVGYCISNEDFIQALLKLNQHLITCAPTFLQDYMSENFDKILKITIPQVKKIVEKRKKVENILKKIGFNYLPGGATFYFMIDVSSNLYNTEALAHHLVTEHNIAVVPGGAYGKSTKNFIRFAIGSENIETIEDSLNIIKKEIDL